MKQKTSFLERSHGRLSCLHPDVSLSMVPLAMGPAMSPVTATHSSACPTQDKHFSMLALAMSLRATSSHIYPHVLSQLCPPHAQGHTLRLAFRSQNCCAATLSHRLRAAFPVYKYQDGYMKGPLPAISSNLPCSKPAVVYVRGQEGLHPNPRARVWAL